MQSRSTATQMLSYLDHIYSLRDNYVPVVAIYFDVNKAFDSVKHNLLLTKLAKYGFDIDFLTLMDSYLFNRRQCNKLDSSLSSEIPVTAGVPQGSVLGLLLFTLFINDIGDNVENSNYFLYCDDLKTLSSAEPVLVHDDLDVLFNWASSKVQHSTRPSVLYCLLIIHLVRLLRRVMTYSPRRITDLGFIITSNLSCETHVD